MRILRSRKHFQPAISVSPGFGDQGFLYDDAGTLTLTWSCFDPAFGALVGRKNPWSLTRADQQKLEAALLPAPSGGRWRFLNPARCVNCGSPIGDPIDRTIYYLLYDGSVQTDDVESRRFSLSEWLRQNA